MIITKRRANHVKTHPRSPEIEPQTLESPIRVYGIFRVIRILKKNSLPSEYYHEVLRIEYHTPLENCPVFLRGELKLDVDYIQSIPKERHN